MPVEAVEVDVDDEAGLVGVGVGDILYPPLIHVLFGHGLVRESSEGRLSVRCSMS